MQECTYLWDQPTSPLTTLRSPSLTLERMLWVVLPSLTCHTVYANCCRSNAENNGNGGLGQWTYPDGRVILNNAGSTTVGEQFYIVRNAPQLIRLARRQSNNPLSPTGSYCCTIPTTGGEITLCANLGE